MSRQCVCDTLRNQRCKNYASVDQASCHVHRRFHADHDISEEDLNLIRTKDDLVTYLEYNYSPPPAYAQGRPVNFREALQRKSRR